MERHKKKLTTGIIVLLSVFLITSVSCKKDTLIGALITVYNECGVTIDVFFDGIFRFTIAHLGFNDIEHVAPGTHVFLAKKTGTQDIVSTFSSDIIGGGNLLWTVKSSATIKVTNAYGQTISIYTDNTYMGDLEDKASNSINHVPYGEHQIDALRTSDNTQIATTKITVVENIEYTWTVSNSNISR